MRLPLVMPRSIFLEDRLMRVVRRCGVVAYVVLVIRESPK
jgi:hypothetical protein